MNDERAIEITGWEGQWSEDDPDANFKADVTLYARVDPLTTLRNLADTLDIPVGGLCHYVLAKWATEGSGALLEIGPTMVRRLAAICDDAETIATDEVRLKAYTKLRGLVSWLRFPLDHPDVYPDNVPPRGATD
jgi:hypothetical protein